MLTRNQVNMSCSGMDAIEEKIKDITECPICFDVYKDPKILPCIHTFCMNCLLETGKKLSKNPKDTMRCPVCRSEFAIPETGFGGLKKNFFMDKLIKMRQDLKPSISFCDLCLEEPESNAEAVILSVLAAEAYCTDCHQNLCQECCKHHKKNKSSKHHKIIPVEASHGAINMGDAFTTDKCEKHANKPLEIYCSECEEVVCSMCFIERHNGHSWSDMKKVACDIKMDIQKSVEYWSTFLPQLDHKMQEFGKHDENVISKVGEVESEICRRRQELKELVDKRAESILQELELLKQHRLKKSKTLKDDIETLLTSLQGYEAYCLQVTQLGSANDLCKAKSILEAAAKELQQRQAFAEERSLKPFDVSFKIMDFQDYSRHQGFNIIGKLIVSDDGISLGRVFDPQLDDINSKLRDVQSSLEKSSQLEDGKTKPVEEQELKFDVELNEQNMHEEEASMKLTFPLTKETKELAMEKYMFQELQPKVENMLTTIDILNQELDIERMHVVVLDDERDLVLAQTKDCESNEQKTKDRVKDLKEQVDLLKCLVCKGGEMKTAKGTVNWEGEFTLSTKLEILPSRCSELSSLWSRNSWK